MYKQEGFIINIFIEEGMRSASDRKIVKGTKKVFMCVYHEDFVPLFRFIDL